MLIYRFVNDLRDCTISRNIREAPVKSRRSDPTRRSIVMYINDATKLHQKKSQTTAIDLGIRKWILIHTRTLRTRGEEISRCGCWRSKNSRGSWSHWSLAYFWRCTRLSPLNSSDTTSTRKCVSSRPLPWEEDNHDNAYRIMTTYPHRSMWSMLGRVVNDVDERWLESVGHLT